MEDKFWVISNTSESYLYHHGIKGQRWGKRNGPPYPLGSDVSTGKVLKKPSKPKKVEAAKKESKPKEKEEDFDPFKAMNEIDKSLSKDEQDLLGVGNDGPSSTEDIKFFFNKDKTAYLLTNDYHGKYKDEHPIDGKIIGIAAKKEARGTGDTDKLISDAKKEFKNDRLVAEIDEKNTASKKLFERNGFTKKMSKDGVDYYTYEKKSSTVKHPLTGEKISGARRPSPEDLDKQIKDASKKAKPDSKTVEGGSEKKGIDKETAKKVAIVTGVAAGLTLAAVGGYMLYKNQGYKYVRDSIPKGTTLQNLSEIKNRPLKGDSFYASYKPEDNNKYIRYFSTDNKANFNSPDGGKTYLIRKYKTLSEVTDDMKVASVNDGRKALMRTLNDNPSLAKQLYDVNQSGYHHKVEKDFTSITGTKYKADKGLQALNKISEGKKISRIDEDRVYNIFNENIVDHKNDELARKVYSELKKSGFSAIMDFEDTNGASSGFAKKPVIIFDKSKYSVLSSERITDDEYKAARDAVYASRDLKNQLKEISKFAKGYGSLAALSTLGITVLVKDNLDNKDKDNKKKK